METRPDLQSRLSDGLLVLGAGLVLLGLYLLAGAAWTILVGGALLVLVGIAAGLAHRSPRGPGRPRR